MGPGAGHLRRDHPGPVQLPRDLAAEFGVPEGGAHPKPRVVALLQAAPCGGRPPRPAATTTARTRWQTSLQGALGPGQLSLADRGFFSIDRWLRFSGTGETAFLHLKRTVRGTGRTLRGRSASLARQEAWALLLVHNMIAALAATTAASAGTSLAAVSFTAVLSLVRDHVAADTCCRHCESGLPAEMTRSRS